MLHRLRQSSRLASLVVLALVAGPAASALCPHPGGTEAHTEADAHGTMAHDASPCHEEAPTPEPETTDCLSPCCVVAPEAPAPAPPVAPAVATHVPLGLVPTDAPERMLKTGRLGTVADPPGPPLRVHLLLERLLT